jgi:alanyl-tRNA synthetase
MSEKNYDPRMHTAEHILNQTMVRKFNCGRAFISHIEKKKSKCDYRISRALSTEDISEIENAVNSIIESNVDVTEGFVTKQEASLFLDLSKLPADAPDSIRVIRVGDYDACACIGPHVKNTSEIGKFKIISSDFNDGIVRLRFKLEN